MSELYDGLDAPVSSEWDKETGLSKAIIALWDFTATEGQKGGCIVNRNDDTNATVFADGVAHKVNSSRFLNPENWVFRPHYVIEENKKDATWDIRLVAEHENNSDSRDNHGTMIINQKNKKNWGWLNDIAWVRKLDTPVSDPEIQFNDAGYLPAFSGGKGNDKRGTVAIPTCRNGGFVTDGTYDGQWAQAGKFIIGPADLPPPVPTRGGNTVTGPNGTGAGGGAGSNTVTSQVGNVGGGYSNTGIPNLNSGTNGLGATYSGGGYGGLANPDLGNSGRDPNVILTGGGYGGTANPGAVAGYSAGIGQTSQNNGPINQGGGYGGASNPGAVAGYSQGVGSKAPPSNTQTGQSAAAASSPFASNGSAKTDGSGGGGSGNGESYALLAPGDGGLSGGRGTLSSGGGGYDGPGAAGGSSGGDAGSSGGSSGGGDSSGYSPSGSGTNYSGGNNFDGSQSGNNTTVNDGPGQTKTDSKKKGNPGQTQVDPKEKQAVEWGQRADCGIDFGGGKIGRWVHEPMTAVEGTGEPTLVHMMVSKQNASPDDKLDTETDGSSNHKPLPKRVRKKAILGWVRIKKSASPTSSHYDYSYHGTPPNKENKSGSSGGSSGTPTGGAPVPPRGPGRDYPGGSGGSTTNGGTPPGPGGPANPTGGGATTGGTSGGSGGGSGGTTETTETRTDSSGNTWTRTTVRDANGAIVGLPGPWTQS